jgi:hypothetical protein
LRNVPVGGGCRKNKRMKKQPSNSTPTASGKLDPPNWLSNSLNQIFHHNSTYNSSLDGNHGFLASGNNGTASGFDLQSQVSSLGFLGQSNQFQNLQQSGIIDDYQIFGSSFLSSFKLPFEDQFNEVAAMTNCGNVSASKEAKLQRESKVQWQIPCDNFMAQIGSNDAQVFNNPLPVYSNGGGVGLSDSVNYGSSVAPLF